MNVKRGKGPIYTTTHLSSVPSATAALSALSSSTGENDRSDVSPVVIGWVGVSVC